MKASFLDGLLRKGNLILLKNHIRASTITITIKYILKPWSSISSYIFLLCYEKRYRKNLIDFIQSLIEITTMFFFWNKKLKVTRCLYRTFFSIHWRKRNVGSLSTLFCLFLVSFLKPRCCYKYKYRFWKVEAYVTEGTSLSWFEII